MKGIIYCYTNLLNGKKYVGQTVRPRMRYNEHVYPYLFKKGKKLQRIDLAIQDEGIENFKYEVLYEVKGKKEVVHRCLNEMEKFYIKQYDCKIPNGYNVLSGGSKIDTATEAIYVKAKRFIKRIKYKLYYTFFK